MTELTASTASQPRSDLVIVKFSAHNWNLVTSHQEHGLIVIIKRK